MLLRIHGVLSLLYQRILTNSTTPPGFDKEDHLLALGQRPAEGLQQAQDQDVQLTNPDEP